VNECSTDSLDKFQIFKINFEVSNLGFSNGVNVEVKLQGLKNFQVYKVFDLNQNILSKNLNIDVLNIGDFKPLEKKEFYVYAKLPLSEWQKLKSNFNPKNISSNI